MSAHSDKRQQSQAVRTTVYSPENTPKEIALADVLAQLSKQQREQLVSGYNLMELARVFEDAETMETADCFLENGMNVSETARKLYMHRNTLMYRLNKIRNLTGLDLHDFESALTFKILRALYELK